MAMVRHQVGHRAIATLAIRAVPPVAGTVEILYADDVFAPGVEEAFIVYQIHGPVDAGRMEIRSARSSTPIVVRTLQPRDLQPGVRISQHWNGRTDAGAFVTPLLGPFEVKVIVDQAGTPSTATREVNVLYASPKLHLAPWTPDGKPPEMEEDDFEGSRRRVAQYLLNEQGYWAGVVGDETDNCLAKAVDRYRMNHPDFFKPSSDAMMGDIDGTFMQALRKENAKRRFLSVEGSGRALTKGVTTRLYVEALLKERGDTMRRRAAEAKRLNRPALAVEAEVRLRSRGGKAVSSPGAVGQVRVNWRISEIGEDLRKQVLNKHERHPALARKYIEKARKAAGGLNRNCPTSMGGIRTSAPWKDAALIGTAYPCYPTTSDAAKEVIVSHAVTNAALKGRFGRAGFVFRPSHIAGDGYRLRAELDFDDEPNGEDLKLRHHGGVEIESGTIRIWKHIQLAGVVQWTAFPKHRWPWKALAEEYARAFLKLELPKKKTAIPITDVLDNASYLQAVKDAGLSPKEFGFKKHFMWGGPVPERDTNAGFYVGYVNDAIREDFSRLQKHGVELHIHRGALRVLGHGIALLEFAVWKPIEDDEGGDTEFASPQAVGYGAAAGVSMIFDRPGLGSLLGTRWEVLHETGHTLDLTHYENIPGHGGIPLHFPEEHDASDHACVMSYAPDSHFGWKDVHFCGRCNLNLRGWNFKKLPANSEGK